LFVVDEPTDTKRGGVWDPHRPVADRNENDERRGKSPAFVVRVSRAGRRAAHPSRCTPPLVAGSSPLLLLLLVVVAPCPQSWEVCGSRRWCGTWLAWWWSTWQRPGVDVVVVVVVDVVAMVVDVVVVVVDDVAAAWHQRGGRGRGRRGIRLALSLSGSTWQPDGVDMVVVVATASSPPTSLDEGRG
jgi:hypothetical protein